MDNIVEKIKKIKIVPVVVIEDLNNTMPLINSLLKGGINVAEVTFRTDAAEEAIKTINNNFKDVLVGAGTILNIEMCKRAIDAGAKFIVSPGYNQDLVDYCMENNILIIPGCITPSEIMAAINSGLNIIKFFPASNFGGVSTIKALLGPFPNISIMPTGGINKDNIKEYLSIKNVIACGGSWMVGGDLVKRKEFSKIEELSREVINIINE